MRRYYCLLNLLIAMSFFFSVGFAQNLAPEPLTLGYQGYLTSLDRSMVDGSYNITFRMYDAPTDGNIIWEETRESVLVAEGYFQLNLGLVNPLPVMTSLDTPLFMSVQVGGDVELSPGLRVGATVRSQWAERAIAASLAEHATDVSGENIHPATISIGEREVINAQGQWVGEPIEGTSAVPADVANELANDDSFTSALLLV